MKRFAAIALILTIGLLTIGCAEGKKAKKAETKPAAEAGADAKAADAAPAAAAKGDEKKDEKK